MKYLIVGRSGVGKDTLVKALMQYGLIPVKSYATRPKRSPDEDTHIFIKPEDVDKYPDKIASTTINGYDYFATKQQVEESDIYVIDPNGITKLITAMPETSFHVIYITSNNETCKEMAIARGNDPLEQEKIYEKRRQSEDQQFSDFEDLIESKDKQIAENCRAIHVIENDYIESTIESWAKYLFHYMKMFNRMKYIVETCADKSILERTKPRHISVWQYKTKDAKQPTKESVPDELFVDTLLADKEGFHSVVSEFLLLPDITLN